eukprot:scaffold7267_cov72-Phaeocystis_antarctica.AAC.4
MRISPRALAIFIISSFTLGSFTGPASFLAARSAARAKMMPMQVVASESPINMKKIAATFPALELHEQQSAQGEEHDDNRDSQEPDPILPLPRRLLGRCRGGYIGLLACLQRARLCLVDHGRPSPQGVLSVSTAAKTERTTPKKNLPYSAECERGGIAGLSAQLHNVQSIAFLSYMNTVAPKLSALNTTLASSPAPARRISTGWPAAAAAEQRPASLC